MRGFIVKGFCEFHDQICLLVPTIHRTIQLLMTSCKNCTNWVSQDLRLRKNHAGSQQICYLRLSACWCCLPIYALGFCSRCRLATPVYSLQHHIFFVQRPGINLLVADHLEHCPELKNQSEISARIGEICVLHSFSSTSANVFVYLHCVFAFKMTLKAAYSVTMNIFRKILFSF